MQGPQTFRIPISMELQNRVFNGNDSVWETPLDMTTSRWYAASLES